MAVAYGWLWHCSQKSRLTRSPPQPLHAGSTGVRTGVCTTTATAATATGVDGLARPRSATTSASNSFVCWLICTAHTPAWFNKRDDRWSSSVVAPSLRCRRASRSRCTVCSAQVMQGQAAVWCVVLALPVWCWTCRARDGGNSVGACGRDEELPKESG